MRRRFSRLMWLYRLIVCFACDFTTCAHPERFIRGGPTLTTFLLLLIRGGERIQITLKASHHRPTSETPLKKRFTGRSMIAKHGMLAW